MNAGESGHLEELLLAERNRVTIFQQPHDPEASTRLAEIDDQRRLLSDGPSAYGHWR